MLGLVAADDLCFQDEKTERKMHVKN
jgi:hypothetical protein